MLKSILIKVFLICIFIAISCTTHRKRPGKFNLKKAKKHKIASDDNLTKVNIIKIYPKKNNLTTNPLENDLLKPGYSIDGKKVEFYHSLGHKNKKGKLDKGVVHFKYGDLVNRAISYKLNNPRSNVEIYISFYKLRRYLFMNFNPQDINYGSVSNFDTWGSNSENFIFTLKKAIENKVTINLMFQRLEYRRYKSTYPSLKRNLKNNVQKLIDFLNPKKTKYLKTVHIDWGADSSKQMHNKYMLVNYIAGHSSVVYTSSANMDRYNSPNQPSGGLEQMGVIVYDHKGLYDAYKRYWNIIAKNSLKIETFREAIRDAHNNQKDPLNYQDDFFSAYFMPLPVACKAAWCTEYNPHVELVAKMKSASKDSEKNLFVNMAYYKIKKNNNSDFAYRFTNEFSKMHNSFMRIYVEEDSEKLEPYKSDNVIINPRWTHSKVFLYSIIGKDNSDYYTVIGSTNFKNNSFMKKANNILMFKEVKPYIFKSILGAVYPTCKKNAKDCLQKIRP